jgi:hypothetical protein
MSARLKLIDWVLTCIMLLLGFFAVVTIGPKIETHFFPVYSQFQILKIKETEDGGTEVVFRYTKLRSCKPAGIMWFIGEPGGAYRQIDLVSNRPPLTTVNRPLGENTSVPYKVDVAPAVLINRGFANIYSNCHPFWVTQSSIYP